MNKKIWQSKWLIVTSTFISTLLLSIVIIWVVQETLPTVSILTNPDFISKTEIEEKFVLKDSLSKSDIYKFEKEGDKTKLVNISKKYFQRDSFKDGNVYERDDLGDVTTLTNKDSSYFKKEDYNDALFYEINGARDNTTLTPIAESNFINKNAYMGADLYTRTPNGKSGELSPLDINDYLRKSEYLNSTLFRKTGTGKSTDFEVLDKTKYTKLNLKFQCLKPDFLGYYIYTYDPVQLNRGYNERETSEPPLNWPRGIIRESDDVIVTMTPGQSFIYESPQGYGPTSLSKNLGDYYTLEKGESKTFYVVGKVVTVNSALQSTYNDFLGTFSVKVTRNFDDTMTADSSGILISKRSRTYDHPYDLRFFAYDDIANNLFQNNLWSSYTAPQEPSEWTSDCYYTQEKA